MNIYKSIPTNKSGVVVIVVLLSLALSVAGISAQDDATSKVINDLCVNGLVNVPVEAGGFNVRGGEPNTQSPIIGRLNKGDTVSVRDVVAGEKVDGRTDWVSLGDTDNDGTLEYAAGALVWPKVDAERILVYKDECKTTPEQLIPPSPIEGNATNEVLVALDTTGGSETVWTDYVTEAMATEIEESIAVARDRAANAIGISPELLKRVDVVNRQDGDSFRFASLFYVQVSGLIKIAWAKDPERPESYFSYNPILGSNVDLISIPQGLTLSAGFSDTGRVVLVAGDSTDKQVVLDTTKPIGTEDGGKAELFVGDSTLQQQLKDANKVIPFGIAIEQSWESLDHLPTVVQDKYANVIYKNPLLKAIKAGEMNGAFVNPLTGDIQRIVDGQMQYYISHPDMKTEQSWYTKKGTSKYVPGVNFYTQTLHPDLYLLFAKSEIHTQEEIDKFINENKLLFEECRKFDVMVIGEQGSDTGRYTRNERWYPGDFKGFVTLNMGDYKKSLVDLEINIFPETPKNECQIYLKIPENYIGQISSKKSFFDRLLGVSFIYASRQVNERNNGFSNFTIPFDINSQFANSSDFVKGQNILVDFLNSGKGEDFTNIPPFPL